MKAPRADYLPHEERLHSLTHGLAAFASAIGLVAMLAKTITAAHWPASLAALVFGLSLIGLYTASSCYHQATDPRRKARWRQLDHAAIYVLIAGSYTPFTLISLRDSWGFWLFAVIWSIAIMGIVLEFVAHLRFKKLSLMLYLVMGWLAIIAINPLLRTVDSAGLWWLLAGGLCYSLGVIFYLWHRLRYHHVIWHLWVVAGSACHFIAIYRYVLPDTASA